MSVGTVVGLDVGYGQVKVVWSHQSGRGPSEGIYPSGAAPIALADRVGFAADGEAALAGGAVEVLVGAERYASLVEPMSLRHGMSTLHANYTSTPEYIALYYGALTKVGAERVKHLVTGLPVSIFKDRDQVREVRERLAGRHEIARGRSVHIDKVSILPQGYGAWAWTVDQLPTGDTSKDVLLVIDFGHFSVDWICFVHNNLRLDSSGSSIRGGSLILDEVSRIIQARSRVKVTREQLFATIRKANGGLAMVKAGRETLDIGPLLGEVAERCAKAVVGEIKASMRDQQMDVTRVMVCGGSAGFFMEAVRDAFDRAAIEIVNQSVSANAYGHRLYGLKFA